MQYYLLGHFLYIFVFKAMISHKLQKKNLVYSYTNLYTITGTWVLKSPLGGTWKIQTISVLQDFEGKQTQCWHSQTDVLLLWVFYYTGMYERQTLTASLVLLGNSTAVPAWTLSWDIYKLWAVSLHLHTTFPPSLCILIHLQLTVTLAMCYCLIYSTPFSFWKMCDISAASVNYQINYL